jgi:hypothetical protein
MVLISLQAGHEVIVTNRTKGLKKVNVIMRDSTHNIVDNQAALDEGKKKKRGLATLFLFSFYIK